jgi:hypothetical protein
MLDALGRVHLERRCKGAAIGRVDLELLDQFELRVALRGTLRSRVHFVHDSVQPEHQRVFEVVRPLSTLQAPSAARGSNHGRDGDGPGDEDDEERIYHLCVRRLGESVRRRLD